MSNASNKPETKRNAKVSDLKNELCEKKTTIQQLEDENCRLKETIQSCENEPTSSSDFIK